MKHIFWMLAICAVGAQAQIVITNAPRTKLEALEARTNTLIVKGSVEIGSVNGSVGAVLVIAKESTDTVTGQKAYGLAVVVRGRERIQDTSYVDYGELDSLLKALAQMNVPNWPQTSMQQVEASYASKDGLRFMSANGPSNSAMEAAIQSTHALQATAYLGVQQLNSLRTLIEQGKGKLSALHATD